MTRHEIEESLKQFNTMVNDPKAGVITMEENLRIIPLTLEEFIEQKVPAEHKDKISEIKDHYIIYLVTNKNKHHYGNHEYMYKWLSNEFFQLAKSQYLNIRNNHDR